MAQELRKPRRRSSLDQLTALAPRETIDGTLRRLTRQSSALASLLWDSISTGAHDAAAWAIGVRPRERVEPAKSVILVTGCSGRGLARELALRFASCGFTVFCQASADQVGGLIARWQALKASNPNSGKLIPLAFLSRDSSGRLEALKTIRAYLREHDCTLTALINTVDATGAPRPAYKVTPSPSTDELPPRVPTPPKTALKASHQPVDDLAYIETPLPLAVSTEEHLENIFGEITAVVGVVQDALPMLRQSKGRVVNVWCRTQSMGLGLLPTGPLALAEDAFRAASRTLGLELRPFGVAVSIVLPGATALLASKPREDAIPPTVSVTNDVRSVLTPASDPTIRAAFATQVRISQRAASLSKYWQVDDALVFRVVRSACEARYPRAVYPIGLDQLALEIGQMLPSNLVALVEAFIHARQRRLLAS